MWDAETCYQRKVVTVSRLVAHAVVGAAGFETTIARLFFKQKQRSMDESRVDMMA